MAKTKVSLTIEKEVWKKFHRYCDERAFNLSGKVELLIREELAYAKATGLKSSKPGETPPNLEFLRERMLKKKALTRKKNA